MRILILLSLSLSLAFGGAFGCASSPGSYRDQAPPPQPLTRPSLQEKPVQQAWSVDARAPVVQSSPEASWPSAPLEGEPRANIIELGYRIYRDYITKVDGARCEHRPTCSRYAIEAVRKHGFVLGAFLSLDRLLRSSRSSTLRTLPSYPHEEGFILFRDPLEENDFFL